MKRALRRRWIQISSITAGLIVLSLVAYIGVHYLKPSHAATGAGTWSWGLADGLSGGGTGQIVVPDPLAANHVTIGGDSWGIFNSTTAGTDWQPAMTGLGVAGSDNVQLGDFFVIGMRYSTKYPGRVYTLTGKFASGTNVGNFGYVEGNSYTVMTRSINGSENTGACGDAAIRPRCTGNRVLVDYDSASDTEYIYVALGNGQGVYRSTDAGATWSVVVGGISDITGMTFSPGNTSTILVGTRTSGAYRLTSVRGTSASSTPLAAAPTRVEEMTTIGGNVYAVADTSGAYKVSANGATWTQLGVGFFSTDSDWSAIGGAGNTIYVGGANLHPGKTMAKSTDGGTSWTWLPASSGNVANSVWGTTGSWWLGTALPRVLFGCYNGCTYESTYISVDAFNPNIIYSSGRSGIWKSEDGGVNWAPAVNHLGGTMHSFVVAGAGNSASTDDVDFNSETTNDNFSTVTVDSTPRTWRAASLSRTIGGHTYTLQTSVPRDMTVDGVSIADAYFKSGVIRPSDIDVSADGKHIYVALFGGGIMVGTLSAGDTTAPSVSLAADQTNVSAGTTVNLTATATDSVGVDHVEFYDGATLLKTDVASPYRYAYDTTSLVVGVHQIVAKAYDAAGNVATSNTINLTITTSTAIPGDVNGDGRVNAIDLSVLISHDGMNYPLADFNHDGIVGAADLAILLAHWTW